MIARALAALAAALLASGCQAAPEGQRARALRALGLMTTLPLYWPEAGDVGEVLRATGETGWVRRALETSFILEPLDALDAATLKGLDNLMLAQPRVLTPDENVALDDWVRAGGKLLLFADPMLTRHSRFGIGDRRRPQDVALLSPILTHWGLELRFDPEEGPGERIVAVRGVPVPVDLAGTLAVLPGGSCSIESENVLALCRIGSGRVTILADAAVLDDPAMPDAGQRRAAILRLAGIAFD